MANLYVTQTGSGTHSGATPSNAWSVAEFNTASNWAGTPTAGKVSPGDTVTLVGTITTPPVMQGSGTSANPITIKFAPVTKLSVPYCSSSGQLQVTNQSHFIIDGAGVGIIESTANGTALANQQAAIGLKITGCTNVTVKNLIVRAIYVRTADSSDSFTGAYGISIENSSNCTVTNCNVSDAEVGVYVYASSGTVDGITISKNSISQVAKGIFVRLAADGTTLSTVILSGNLINSLFYWDGMWDGNWHDLYGILIEGRELTTDPITQVLIRENRVGGDVGAHCNALIMLRYAVIAPRLHNNFLSVSPDNPINGMVVIQGVGGLATSSAALLNNTFVGLPSPAVPAVRTVAASGLTFRNNILKNCAQAIVETDPFSATAFAGNNLYYNLGSPGFFAFGDNLTLSQWQASGFDVDALTEDPLIDANGIIQNRTSPAVGAGVNLSTSFQADLQGKTRPLSYPWDLGAVAFVYSVRQRLSKHPRIKVLGLVTMPNVIVAPPISENSLVTMAGDRITTFAGDALTKF